MSDTDTIERILKRAELNQLSQDLGIRPLGQVLAKSYELRAELADIAGDSLEAIEELRLKAQAEYKLDLAAERLTNQSIQALDN